MDRRQRQETLQDEDLEEIDNMVTCANFRQHNQGNRIQDGVQSGELTRGEARELRQEHRDIREAIGEAKSDGKMTFSEAREINALQNDASRDIYQAKHDGDQRGEMPRVDRRESRQDGRIEDGVDSGQITRGEQRLLGMQQRRIDRAEHRAEADGEVTPQERQRLDALQDHASAAIFAARHNHIR